MNIIIAIISLFIFPVLRGFVLKYLWLWFAVPFGLMPISIAHAIGISLIISFLTYQQDARKTSDDEDTSILISFFSQVTIIFVLLLMGYIIKLFM